MTAANDNDTKANRRSCPMCGKPPLERFRPFCSKRCADVDLNRWLSGTYAIPTNGEDDEHPRDDSDEAR